MVDIDRAAQMAKAGLIGAPVQQPQPQIQQVVQIQTQEFLIARLVEVGILTAEQGFNLLFGNPQKPVTDFRGVKDVVEKPAQLGSDGVIQIGK